MDRFVNDCILGLPRAGEMPFVRGGTPNDQFAADRRTRGFVDPVPSLVHGVEAMLRQLLVIHRDTDDAILDTVADPAQSRARDMDAAGVAHVKVDPGERLFRVQEIADLCA